MKHATTIGFLYAVVITLGFVIVAYICSGCLFFRPKEVVEDIPYSMSYEVAISDNIYCLRRVE